MIRKNKGFTLIELLVVIAIIGILSSVVLASLNSARSKGADAAVKTAMGSLVTQAALVYDNAGASGYLNLWTDSQVLKITANIAANALAIATSTASSTYYEAIATLKGGSYWCVDSNNVAITPTVTTVDGLGCR